MELQRLGGALAAAAATVFVCTGAGAQNHRIIPTSNPGESLSQRYSSAVCAIVYIQTENGNGTGFFINSSGDILTAAHVVSTHSFSMVNNQISVTVNIDHMISISPHGVGPNAVPMASVVETTEDDINDLALIHSKLKPPCILPLAEADVTQPGTHLISIGFPGIDSGNPILYEGFLSGRFPRPKIASIGEVNGQSIFPNRDVMKVQMPITPGASGSPVIEDSGRVVGVISEAPMIWTADLEKITGMASRGSGVWLSGFDTVSILGQLALVVREFETTGSGYAVPVSYWHSKPRPDSPASTSGH